MELLYQTIPLNCNIFLFGDDHEGTTLRSNRGWDKLIDAMLSPWGGIRAANNYGIHHGDHIEAIMVDDPRYDPRVCTTYQPLEQNQQAKKNFLPIKKQMVTILDGNHPWKLWKFGPLTKALCKELNVRYGSWTSKIIWKNRKGDIIFKTYHTHGRKTITSTADDPIRQEANWKLALKKQLKEKAGDCMLLAKGHTHKLLVSEPKHRLYLTDDGKKLRQGYADATPTDVYIHHDLRWYVNTGSFFRSIALGVESYSERFEYDPLELGFCVAEVRDGEIADVKKVLLED
jgi:hypothetical protein